MASPPRDLFPNELHPDYGLLHVLLTGPLGPVEYVVFRILI
jgi:hypothetical protein